MVKLSLFGFQNELMEGYKREGIDPTPYFWYTDQVIHQRGGNGKIMNKALVYI